MTRLGLETETEEQQELLCVLHSHEIGWPHLASSGLIEVLTAPKKIKDNRKDQLFKYA